MYHAGRDRPVLTSQEEVQEAFQQLSEQNGGNVSAAQLSDFVDQYFGTEGRCFHPRCCCLTDGLL